MKHEYRPLLETTRPANIESSPDKPHTPWLSKLLSIIALLAIIGVFCVYNNKNGLSFLKHNNNNNNKNNINSNIKNNALNKLNLIEWDSKEIELEPNLPPHNGISIDLVDDDGVLNFDTCSSIKIGGELVKESQNVVLHFFVDGSAKYVFFSRTNTKTNVVEESFYSQKTADPNQNDYYQFDGVFIDVDDTEAIAAGFKKFFESQLTMDIIELSMKIAARGYTGKMAKSIRMLHAFAVHLQEFPSVQERYDKNTKFEINRQRLNEFFTAASDESSNNNNKQSTNNNWLIDYNNLISSDNSGDGCPGATDGCPSYCYTVGGCATEDKCDNECFGQCGNGCSCWSWVCGDCGCHCLCENHDYFCSCVSMYGYSCWALWEWIDDDCD